MRTEPSGASATRPPTHHAGSQRQHPIIQELGQAESQAPGPLALRALLSSGIERHVCEGVGWRLTRHGANPVPGPEAHLLPSLGLQFGWCLLCLSPVHAEVRAGDRGPKQSVTRVPHGLKTSTALSQASLGTVGVEQAGGGRFSHLNSGLPSSSPESRPRSDRVPVPTLVVTVISLFPTSQVLVLPPARRNSPTGDLKAQE